MATNETALLQAGGRAGAVVDQEAGGLAVPFRGDDHLVGGLDEHRGVDVAGNTEIVETGPGGR